MTSRPLPSGRNRRCSSYGRERPGCERQRQVSWSGWAPALDPEKNPLRRQRRRPGGARSRRRLAPSTNVSPSPDPSAATAKQNAQTSIFRVRRAGAKVRQPTQADENRDDPHRRIHVKDASARKRRWSEIRLHGAQRHASMRNIVTRCASAWPRTAAAGRSSPSPRAHSAEINGAGPRLEHPRRNSGTPISGATRRLAIPPVKEHKPRRKSAGSPAGLRTGGGQQHADHEIRVGVDHYHRQP